MTPKTIDTHVLKLLDILNATHEPIYLEVAPEIGVQISDCFPSVEKKVKENGGKMILGWQIWKSKNIVEAECHAVWENQDGDLKDITPKIYNVDTILFVEDENLRYEGKQIDNVRLNISNNKLVDDLILVCKKIFEFENRGNRALEYNLSSILSHEQSNHLLYMKEIYKMINALLSRGGTRDSKCLCNSGKKFKNCHGENLNKNLSRIK